MKIKIKKMVLENFMCYEKEEVDFFEKTIISGRNGSGKSSIATAYTWLMFGCDYQLKDNPAVRRIVDGTAVDGDVSVTAILDIDGKEVSVKKVQKRKYKKDKVSYSDDNSYFINDVPKTLKAFNEHLSIDVGLFKLCSNPGAFLNLKTADMRTYLFNLVEDITDHDIAVSNAELADLVPILENYTAEELKAMNKATVAKINKDLPAIDGQIKEKERDIQLKYDVDLAELELLRNALKEQLENNLKKQTDADALEKDIESKEDEILQLKFKLSDMQMKANDDLRKKRHEIQLNITDCQNTIDAIENSMLTEKAKSISSDIENKRKFKQYLANEWKSVNAEAFDESSTICPTCNRELPDAEIKRLVEEFAENKKLRLDMIAEKGNGCNKQIESLKASLEDVKKEITKNADIKAEVSEKLRHLKNELSKLPETVNFSENEEYKKLSDEIDRKDAEFQNTMKTDDIRSKLKNEETIIRRKLSDCESKINLSDTSAEEQRVEELKSKRMDMEQSKTDAEKVLYFLDELEKAKNEKLSDEINKHFKIVKWQLFEINKSGGYKSVCIPTVDGKSILSSMSNKGNQIIGKVDICNSIQKDTGVSLPIFIDDAESLDCVSKRKIQNMLDCQIIMLQVDSFPLEISEYEE